MININFENVYGRAEQPSNRMRRYERKIGSKHSKSILKRNIITEISAAGKSKINSGKSMV